MLNFTFIQPNDVPPAGNVQTLLWIWLSGVEFVCFLSKTLLFPVKPRLYDSKFTSTATHCSAAPIWEGSRRVTGELETVYATTGSNHATMPCEKQSGKTWLWLPCNGRIKTYIVYRMHPTHYKTLSQRKALQILFLLLMLGPGPCRSRLWRATAFSEPQTTREMHLAACPYIYIHNYRL